MDKNLLTLFKEFKMKMTKKNIIELLKCHSIATVGFNGLISRDMVDKARQEIITHWQEQIDEHKKQNPDAEINMIISDRQVSVGGSQFQFLPQYPRTGSLVVKSKEFMVDQVYCKIADILTDTFNQTTKSFGFKMKSGSTICVNKFNYVDDYNMPEDK